MPCEKHARYVLLAQFLGDMVSGHGVSHSPKNHIRETLQTAFIPHRQGAEAVYMIERCTELAREWSIPVFIAAVADDAD